MSRVEGVVRMPHPKPPVLRLEVAPMSRRWFHVEAVREVDVVPHLFPPRLPFPCSPPRTLLLYLAVPVAFTEENFNRANTFVASCLKSLGITSSCFCSSSASRCTFMIHHENTRHFLALFVFCDRTMSLMLTSTWRSQRLV